MMRFEFWFSGCPANAPDLMRRKVRALAGHVFPPRFLAAHWVPAFAAFFRSQIPPAQSQLRPPGGEVAGDRQTVGEREGEFIVSLSLT